MLFPELKKIKNRQIKVGDRKASLKIEEIHIGRLTVILCCICPQLIRCHQEATKRSII